MRGVIVDCSGFVPADNRAFLAWMATTPLLVPSVCLSVRACVPFGRTGGGVGASSGAGGSGRSGNRVDFLDVSADASGAAVAGASALGDGDSGIWPIPKVCDWVCDWVCGCVTGCVTGCFVYLSVSVQACVIVLVFVFLCVCHHPFFCGVCVFPPGRLHQLR